MDSDWSDLSKFQSTRPCGARPMSMCILVILMSFNPRAHVGRDRTITSSSSPKWFQSTRPCGARLSRVVFMDDVNVFQSTRPCGARPSMAMTALSSVCFNPRAHVGRDSIDNCKKSKQRSFNPRAHVGRDVEHDTQSLAKVVSIHAPMWGATSISFSCALSLLFQSTRPCGARPSFTTVTRTNCLFQSTRPCGARPSGKFECVPVSVSIHAPMWGATITGRAKVSAFVFQSTRPCGARRSENSVSTSVRVSIHAPMWGATCQDRPHSTHRLFQSTRPCGARLVITAYTLQLPRSFNPRAHVGRDH